MNFSVRDINIYNIYDFFKYCFNFFKCCLLYIKIKVKYDNIK